MLDYKIAKLSDQVYEIQDFVTKDELDQVMQFIKARENSDWHEENISYDFWKDKVLSSSFINENPIFIKIYDRVCRLFTGYAQVTGINLQRYFINDALGEHTDDHEGHRINDEKIFYGVVLYYNDDYKGGELNYPDLKIVHKPTAGSLLLHAGEILHGTLPVQDNVTRYISTMFVKHKLNEFVSLNKDVFGEINGI